MNMHKKCSNISTTSIGMNHAVCLFIHIILQLLINKSWGPALRAGNLSEYKFTNKSVSALDVG